MLNVQVMEEVKGSHCVVYVLNRLFCEVDVPKICYIDKDSAMMKVLSEGQVQVMSNEVLCRHLEGLHLKRVLSRGLKHMDELKLGSGCCRRFWRDLMSRG